MKLMLASPVPEPEVKLRPLMPPRVSTPLPVVSVTCSAVLPASTSATVIALPPPLENTSGLFEVMFCAAGTLSTGGSLTAATSKVKVLAMGSVSAPPLVTPPSSRTRKVNAA